MCWFCWVCLGLRLFFFSSRRRHTRSLCDWSSDVCSSDLFLEHSVLSETLFTFLTACGVYAAVRCTAEERSWAWPVLAGVALACATGVRVVGMATIVIVCVWMALA